MRLTNRRVSTPAMPTRLRSFSQRSIEPGSPVGRGSNVFAQYEAETRRRTRLDVLVVGTDVPDMREGEGDDLARIGRIGEDLLVSGHRGVEAHLPQGLAEGAEASSAKDSAVLQDQHGVPGHLIRGRDRCQLPIELHDWLSL